jgi:predicted transcriptional regulator of viral defense system
MPKGEGVLYHLAEPQAGYFTTGQAQADHVSRQQLWYLQQTGAIERAAHGIYRLARFPAQRFEDLVVACLWAP